MNGQPLPVEHGFPVRMVVPGLYGYVSATKWLVDLEVTRFDEFDGLLDRARLVGAGTGQDRVAHRRTPRRAARSPPGRCRFGGAPGPSTPASRRSSSSSTAAPWQEAELGRGAERRHLGAVGAATCDVKPGEHTLVVRATDRSGHTQTSVRADVSPTARAAGTPWSSRRVTADPGRDIASEGMDDFARPFRCRSRGRWFRRARPHDRPAPRRTRLRGRRHLARAANVPPSAWSTRPRRRASGHAPGSWT